MEWYEPVWYPAHAVGDPRLRPRHHSLLLAVRYLVERECHSITEGLNADLQRWARIKDRQTFYKHRQGLHDLDYFRYLRIDGYPTEYEVAGNGHTLIPAGLVTDRNVTSPGAVSLYIALATLARGDGYGTHCDATNQQVMTAAGFSTRRQLTRYRTELNSHNLLTITHPTERAPRYRLPLNQAAQDKYLSVITASA